MVLPVIKLGSLFVRTISKPIATRLKQAAVYHPKFRGLIINLAQGYHRLTTIMQRHTLGRSTALEIRPLNEERAVEAATDLLRELFVFSVAGFAMLFEVQRNTRSEAKKEELRKQQIEVMKLRNKALEEEMKHLAQRMEQLEMAAKQRNAYRFWTWRAYENPNLGIIKGKIGS
ncbi:OPA3-like protein [Salvia miltiorrhiza]|uniref:OPA3-like protein n=1 Tax=Salvia miltiorrhiza TaxID=226208 RepID=UPI0025AD951A|nr:OPA3-like protein [Salvia miltiorrhiza]